MEKMARSKRTITDKKSVKRQTKRVVCFILIFVVFYGIAYAVYGLRSDYISVRKYATADVTYADGTTKHFDSYYFGTVNKGDKVTVHVFLPEEYKRANSSLCFAIYHSVTQVWYKNKLLATGGEKLYEEGKMVGYAQYTTIIPDVAWGDELTINLTATENNAFARIHSLDVYYTPKSYQFFINENPISFISSLPMIFVTIIFFLFVLFSGQMNRLKKKGSCFSVCMMILATYILTGSGLPYMIVRSNIWTQIEFMSAMTVSYPLLLYIALNVKKKWCRIACLTLFVIDIAFFVTATALHFTNVLHYCAVLNYGHILTGINALIIIIYAIAMKNEKRPSLRILYDGFIILGLCGLAEVLRTSIPFLIKLELPSILHLGLFSVMVCMILSYAIELSEYQKRNTAAEIREIELLHMVEETPAGICVFKREPPYEVIKANDMFYSILGFTKESAEKAGYSHLTATLDAKEEAHMYQIIETARKDNIRNGEVEFMFHDQSGKQRTILTKYNVSDDSKHITISVIDITDRKKMETELRVSEERYRLALNQSGKVFFFFDVPTKTMHLSRELADAFGLPMIVDNMPDNFISQGLVEPESVEAYRDFYKRIFAGEKTGDTIISCHMRSTPENVLWYRIAFTTIFDDDNQPSSSVITYEDINDQYHAALTAQWKQINFTALYGDKYSALVYDLIRNRIVSQDGEMFGEVFDSEMKLDKLPDYSIKNYVHEDDRDMLQKLLNRERLIELYKSGASEDSIEYRSKLNSTDYRWYECKIQMITDPYNMNIMAQILIIDINEQKSGEIEMHQNMEKLQKQLENSRIRVMINQMQPHFLYNALSAIQTIVKVDPDYAYKMIYAFTIHLRSSIKALSSDEPIPFDDEIKNVKAYLNIEKMRFGDKMNVEYELECTDFSVVPLSIQPLAENAARHGLYPLGIEGGTIWIRTRETESAYIIEVEDNGVGFNVQEVMNLESDSIGLKNVIFRAKHLMNADVILKSEIGKGTLVRVKIPKSENGGEKNENNYC